MKMSGLNCIHTLLLLKKRIVLPLRKRVILSSNFSNRVFLGNSRMFMWSSVSMCYFSKFDCLSKILCQHLLNSNINRSFLSFRRRKQSGTFENSTGDKQEKFQQFSRKSMKYIFIAFGSIFVTLAGSILYFRGSMQASGEGNEHINDEFMEMPAWKAYVCRAYKEMMHYGKVIKDPSREKLLPDPLTEPYYQPPFTLVLEMTGVLVHPDWTYQTGWRFKKRPGVDHFLQQIGPPMFEVVVFTSEQGFTAFPILDSLDPAGYITYRLFRDATRYINGHHVKDLSYLNRDLSKVIFLDWNENSFAFQKKNALKLKKWMGDDDDKTLYDLAILLRTIATSNISDVRPILEYYGKFDDPISVFKENTKKLQEDEKMHKAEQNRKPILISILPKNLLNRK